MGNCAEEQRVCKNCSQQHNPEVQIGRIIGSILCTRKLRNREIKSWSQDSNFLIHCQSLNSQNCKSLHKLQELRHLQFSCFLALDFLCCCLWGHKQSDMTERLNNSNKKKSKSWGGFKSYKYLWIKIISFFSISYSNLSYYLVSGISVEMYLQLDKEIKLYMNSFYQSNNYSSDHIAIMMQEEYDYEHLCLLSHLIPSTT